MREGVCIEGEHTVTAAAMAAKRGEDVRALPFSEPQWALHSLGAIPP